MSDIERFKRHLANAEAAERAEDVPGAVKSYLGALRVITPSDDAIESAMILQSLGSRVLVEKPHTDMADSHIRSKLVSLYRRLGDSEEALRHAKIALYLDRALHGEDHNNTSASWQDVAFTYLDLGQNENMLAAFNETQRIDERLATSAEFGWQVAYRMVMRGSILADHGYVEQSARFASVNLGRFADLFTDTVDLVRAYDRACQCLQNMGEHATALRYMRLAERASRKEEVPQRLRDVVLANLAVLLEEMGMFAEADTATRSLSGASRFHGRDTEDAKRQIDEWRQRKQGLESGSAAPHDIFVSFNVRHERLVDALANSLVACGLDVWTFRHADDGSNLGSNTDVVRRMQAEIDRSLMVVALGASTSFTSRFVLAELDHTVKSNVPMLMWYPEGIRLQPEIASTWGTEDQKTLRAITLRLAAKNVFSIYGYGLRDHTINVIRDAIVKQYMHLYGESAEKPYSECGRITDKALYPTKMWPVLLGRTGKPIVPELMTADPESYK